jgi:hypothetical protein
MLRGASGRARGAEDTPTPAIGERRLPPLSRAGTPLPERPGPSPGGVRVGAPANVVSRAPNPSGINTSAS